MACGFSAAGLAATVEVHWDTWNGSSFKRAGDYTSDFSPADDGNGTWQLLPTATGAPELGFIKLRNTGSGTVEVHVDQLIDGAYKRIASYPSDFSPRDAGNGVWQLFGSVNGLPELGFIKLRNTGSGTVEVHWDAWNGSSFKRAGDYTSDFSPGDADNGAWDLFGSVNGAPELGFVKLYDTGSGTVEAHWDVLSNGRYRRAGSYRSDFSPADAGNGVWSLFGSVNGAPELTFAKVRNTGTGTVEAHWAVLSGGSYVRAGDYGSDFSVADANNGVWSLSGSVNGKPELGFIKLRWPAAPAPVVMSPPVQPEPIVVTVPKPHGRRHVKVRITLGWTWNRAQTRLNWIKFGRLPKAAMISVGCRGLGCPRPRAMSARARQLRGLVRSLAGRRYRAGDRLLIRISVPGEVPERAEVWIRYGEIPRARLM